MTLKERLKYIWDWYIVWYLKDKPVDIYKTIRHWWKCNGQNPYHWKLIWYTAFHHYGWDNDFNWEVIRLCILKSHYYFERHQYISDTHLKHILMWQKIAIGLLDIILEKREMWTMEHYEDSKLEDVSPQFFKSVYKCLVKVNQRNMNRFPHEAMDYNTGKRFFTVQHYKEQPHELYIEKARKLMITILDRYSTEWWD